MLAVPHKENAARALPYSEESERAVLAGILLSPHLLLLVAGRLTADDFYLERHAVLYRAMLELGDEQVEIDLRTLQARLEQQGTFASLGGLAYLAGLDSDLPDLSRIETYVELVKERSVRRRLIEVCEETTRDCYDGGLEAKEALARAEKSVLGLSEEAMQRDFTPLAEIFQQTVADLEERAEQRGLIGLPSGFYDWDQMTQGLVDGNLIIVAGRPGMGKTSFAVNVAQHVAVRDNSSVAIFSLEMGKEELAMRILASEADLPFGNLRAGRLSEGQWEKLYGVIRQIEKAPIHIDDSPNPTLLEIGSKARRLKAEQGLDMLILDYIQLMQSGTKFENRNLEIASISRGLKQLAKELSIPVMALSQLSRGPERRTGDHRPQLADLRESGSIEQDADMVCFVYRDELYNKEDPDNKGLAELIISKHRNGQTGTVHLVFIGETTSFRNFDRHHGGGPPDHGGGPQEY